MAKTMTLIPILIAYASLIMPFIFISKCDPSTNIDIGFTTDLIHINSPQSPTHDASLSPAQHLANTFRRSINRLQHFKRSPKSKMIASNGEYLMKYSIGTPPVPTFAIADTGSDAIWTQCSPCLECFNQTPTLFTPNNSSTYKRIRCKSLTCTSLDTITSCSKRRQNCLYSEEFGDGSFTYGELSTDTITLASTSGQKVISVSNIIIGCGFRNGGMFEGGESGIVGLGGGNASLVRQLGSLTQGKFSYCLVSQSGTESIINSGQLNFGAKARVSGEEAVSTPLVLKEPSTFYFLTLGGISVGNKRVNFNDLLLANSRASKEGNMIIDSGTGLTFLPYNIYTNLVKGLNSSIKLRRIIDPLGQLDLCFFTRKGNTEFPEVTFHFKGADVKLKQDNVFVRTSNVSLCLAALPVPEQLGYGIYGNMAQANFLVGYDLEKRTVSFKPTHCGK